jgi:hypothetical protein
MEALSMLQEALTKDEQRRSQAIELLEGALSLLKGNGEVSAKAMQMARLPRNEKPRYIERAVEIIQASGKPMGPADITAVLRKQPEFADIRRNAIERAIFMELRKEHPRLKKVGVGLYDVAREARRKSA